MSDEHVIENHDSTAVEMDVQIDDEGDVLLNSNGDELLVLEEERDELAELLSMNDQSSVENGVCTTVDGCDGTDTPSVMTVEDDSDTVAFDCLVDVSDASDDQKQMYREMASIYEQQFKTFVEKNQSYGNSWRDTDVGGFDTSFESNANGLMVRMNDKMNRLDHLLFSGGEDHVGESAVDTALDLSNYGLLLAYLIQEHDG